MPFATDNIIKTKPIIQPLVKISPVFADTYEGEWVNWMIGDEVQREFLSPKVNFFRPNSSAIVFGNGIGRKKDIIDRIIKSNSKKIINYYNVIYACNLAYKDVDADFFVTTNKLVASKYPKELHERTYTRPEFVRIHSQMNLIPINYDLDAGATAVMLACFHGATKVFLYGFDGCPQGVTNHIYCDQEFQAKAGEEINDQKWQDNLFKVMSAYTKTEFYRVNGSPPNGRMLQKLPNYSVIDLRRFISLADI